MILGKYFKSSRNYDFRVYFESDKQVTFGSLVWLPFSLFVSTSLLVFVIISPIKDNNELCSSF